MSSTDLRSVKDKASTTATSRLPSQSYSRTVAAALRFPKTAVTSPTRRTTPSPTLASTPSRTRATRTKPRQLLLSFQETADLSLHPGAVGKLQVLLLLVLSLHLQVLDEGLGQELRLHLRWRRFLHQPVGSSSGFEGNCSITWAPTAVLDLFGRAELAR